MKLLFCMLSLSATLLGQTGISGYFAYPDGTLMNGKVLVSLTRSTVTNTCDVQQVVTFSPVTVMIMDGVLGSLTLMPTKCISPAQEYLVKVYSLPDNTMLYQSHWTVPWYGGAWHSITHYVIGSYVTYNNVTYISLYGTTIAPNLGNVPSSSPTKWQVVMTDVSTLDSN